MTKKKIPDHWLSTTEVCRFTGIRRGNLNRDLLNFLPKDAIERDDRNHFRIWGPAVCEHFRARGQAEAEKPEAETSASPALERLRAIKVEREQFLYERERGEWVELKRVQNGMNALAEGMRHLTDELGRSYGPEAQELVDELVQQAMARSRQALGEPTRTEVSR